MHLSSAKFSTEITGEILRKFVTRLKRINILCKTIKLSLYVEEFTLVRKLVHAKHICNAVGYYIFCLGKNTIQIW